VHDVVKRVCSIEELKAPIHYDVFLNHRGTDVKNTLASQLYNRFRDHGLRVFLDKEESRKGNRIKSEMQNAIRFARIHVAIFSAGYAESAWCMDELLLMIKSGSIIIPVFYNLNPTEMWSNPVDGPKGVYAEALRMLKEEKILDPETHREIARYQSDSIENWKEALMEVTGREGFKLTTYDGDEGQLVDNVVREVIERKVKNG